MSFPPANSAGLKHNCPGESIVFCVSLVIHQWSQAPLKILWEPN